MKLDQLINIFIRIMVWFWGIIFIVMVLWKLLGNSPTFNELLMSFLTIIVGALIKHEKGISRLETHQEYNKDNFRRIETEIKEIKTDLNKGFKEMRNRFERIEKKLS